MGCCWRTGGEAIELGERREARDVVTPRRGRDRSRRSQWPPVAPGRPCHATTALPGETQPSAANHAISHAGHGRTTSCPSSYRISRVLARLRSELHLELAHHRHSGRQCVAVVHPAIVARQRRRKHDRCRKTPRGHRRGNVYVAKILQRPLAPATEAGGAATRDPNATTAARRSSDLGQNPPSLGRSARTSPPLAPRARRVTRVAVAEVPGPVSKC